MTCKCIIFHNLQKLFIPYHTIKIPHLKPPTHNTPQTLINTSKNEFSYNKITLTKHTTKKHKHKHTNTPHLAHLPRVHVHAYTFQASTQKNHLPQSPQSLLNKDFYPHLYTHILKYSFYIYQ